MKTGTLSCLQVNSYLSASTTGNIKYDLGISFYDQSLSGSSVAWSLAALDTTIAWILPSLGLGITAAVIELGGYTIALQWQPNPPHLVRLATSQMGNP